MKSGQELTAVLASRTAVLPSIASDGGAPERLLVSGSAARPGAEGGVNGCSAGRGR